MSKIINEAFRMLNEEATTNTKKNRYVEAIDPKDEKLLNELQSELDNLETELKQATDTVIRYPNRDEYLTPEQIKEIDELRNTSYELTKKIDSMRKEFEEDRGSWNYYRVGLDDYDREWEPNIVTTNQELKDKYEPQIEKMEKEIEELSSKVSAIEDEPQAAVRKQYFDSKHDKETRVKTTRQSLRDKHKVNNEQYVRIIKQVPILNTLYTTLKNYCDICTIDYLKFVDTEEGRKLEAKLCAATDISDEVYEDSDRFISVESGEWDHKTVYEASLSEDAIEQYFDEKVFEDTHIDSFEQLCTIELDDETIECPANIKVYVDTNKADVKYAYYPETWGYYGGSPAEEYIDVKGVIGHIDVTIQVDVK